MANDSQWRAERTYTDVVRITYAWHDNKRHDWPPTLDQNRIKAAMDPKFIEAFVAAGANSAGVSRRTSIDSLLSLSFTLSTAIDLHRFRRIKIRITLVPS